MTHANASVYDASVYGASVYDAVLFGDGRTDGQTDSRSWKEGWELRSYDAQIFFCQINQVGQVCQMVQV